MDIERPTQPPRRAARPPAGQGDADYEPRSNTFLARRAYRRRRLLDAARMLPAFALALFVLPTLWISVEQPGGTAHGFIYIFAVWLALIGIGGFLARRIAGPVRAAPRPHDDARPDD